MPRTNSARSPKELLVKINSRAVWSVPRARFEPELPLTSARRFGQLLYHRVMGEWFEAVPGRAYSSGDPPVRPEIRALVEALPNILTDER